MCRTTPDTQMEGQRRIIEDLARLKDEFATRLDPIASAIQASATDAIPRERALPGIYNSTQMAVDVSGPLGQSPGLDLGFEKISHYSHLINTLLEEVDIVQNRMDADLRTRIWNDIVHTHRRETTAMKRIYGYERLQKAMRGKAWDLVRVDLERSGFATVPAATVPHDISEISNDSLALLEAFDVMKMGTSQVHSRVPNISFSPKVEQPDNSPPGPQGRATSPPPTSPCHSKLEWRGEKMAWASTDAAISPMGSEPEDYESHFEVQDSDKELPLANVARIMKKALPSDASITREAKETMQECVGELISLITHEAVKKSNLRGGKTLRGEELLLAFHHLGFERYAEALTIYLAGYRGVTRDDIFASLRELSMLEKEHVESSRSEKTQKELAGTPSQDTLAEIIAWDISDDDAHVMETKIVDEGHSVVDELLAQWTIL